MIVYDSRGRIFLLKKSHSFRRKKTIHPTWPKDITNRNHWASKSRFIGQLLSGKQNKCSTSLNAKIKKIKTRSSYYWLITVSREYCMVFKHLSNLSQEAGYISHLNAHSRWTICFGESSLAPKIYYDKLLLLSTSFLSNANKSG